MLVLEPRQLPSADSCGASRADVRGAQGGDPQGLLPLAHLAALLDQRLSCHS